MLELNHMVNSVCARKVRIQLTEKALDWKSHLMTLQGDQFEEAYLKLNPNGVVPTVVHDRQPIIESSVILYYLEECFPETRLMPQDPQARATVRLFNKLIDEYVHNACTVLTFAIAFRSHFGKMNPADFESYLAKAPNQKRSDQKREVVAHGLNSAKLLNISSSCCNGSSARRANMTICPGMNSRSRISPSSLT
jgi:glutathione S-transferase